MKKGTIELVTAILAFIVAIFGLIGVFKPDKKTDTQQTTSVQSSVLKQSSNGLLSTRDLGTGQQIIQGDVLGNQEIYFGSKDVKSSNNSSSTSTPKIARKRCTTPEDKRVVPTSEIDSEEFYYKESVGKDSVIHLDTNGLGAAKFEVRMKNSYKNQ